MLEKNSCHEHLDRTKNKQFKNGLKLNKTKGSRLESTYPSHSEFIPRLKRIEGQVAGIQKMISDRRYCVDILIQFQAVSAALMAIEKVIFEKHLKSCVKNTVESKNSIEIEQKTKELINLVFKRLE